MAKTLGYILSAIGLIIIIFSKKIESLSFLSAITKIGIYTIVVGVALVLAGVVFLMGKSSSKVQQVAEEVPIYEGEGKKRRIVGYKKAK